MTEENDSVEIHLLRQWAAGEKPQWETMQLLTELEREIVQRYPFLVHGLQTDGEHEHRVNTIVWAKDQVELNIFIEGKIFTHDHGDLDDEDAFFGYGDRQTATKFTGSESLTEDEAEMLQKLGIVHWWNNPCFAVAHDSKISPYAKAGGHPMNSDSDSWNDNSIQFPRLIAEAEAEGLFHSQAIHDLCVTMDLTATEVSEIIDRAQQQWDEIKAGTATSRVKTRPVGKHSKPEKPVPL